MNGEIFEFNAYTTDKLTVTNEIVMEISPESEKGWVKKGERTDKRWKIGKHVSYLCLILSILNSVGDGMGGGKIFLDPPPKKNLIYEYAPAESTSDLHFWFFIRLSNAFYNFSFEKK